MSTIRARLADMQTAALIFNKIESTLDDITSCLNIIKNDFATVWSDRGYDTFIPYLEKVAEQVQTLYTNEANCKNALNFAIKSYTVIEGQNSQQINAVTNEFSFPV